MHRASLLGPHIWREHKHGEFGVSESPSPWLQEAVFSPVHVVKVFGILVITFESECCMWPWTCFASQAKLWQPLEAVFHWGTHLTPLLLNDLAPGTQHHYTCKGRGMCFLCVSWSEWVPYENCLRQKCFRNQQCSVSTSQDESSRGTQKGCVLMNIRTNCFTFLQLPLICVLLSGLVNPGVSGSFS